MRALVYTDYQYRSDGTAVYADKAFAMFLTAVAENLDGMVLAGRLRRDPGQGHYRLPDTIGFLPLDRYESLARPTAAVPAFARSLRRFWRALGDVDAVWVLGPHPLGVAFVILAAARHRRVVLGVRQDLPRYVRMRHPDRRELQAAGLLLEGIWRLLARRLPVVTVGPELEHHYRHARSQLSVSVSLVRDEDLAQEHGADRSYEGVLQVLSVGRLETEKAPLLLPEILKLLCARDPRWRMVVCGEGPLRDALLERVSAMSLDQHFELRGYVPVHDGLLDVYRSSHFLLHVSLTEGLPQVLYEAFSTRTPVVATAVGGVPRAADGCALLIPPRDAASAAAALERLAHDAGLREQLVERAAQRVAGRTMEAESAAVARFISGSTGTRKAWHD